jgi:hypothetical protein
MLKRVLPDESREETMPKRQRPLCRLEMRVLQRQVLQGPKKASDGTSFVPKKMDKAPMVINLVSPPIPSPFTEADLWEMMGGEALREDDLLGAFDVDGMIRDEHGSFFFPLNIIHEAPKKDLWEKRHTAMMTPWGDLWEILKIMQDPCINVETGTRRPPTFCWHHPLFRGITVLRKMKNGARLPALCDCHPEENELNKLKQMDFLIQKMPNQTFNMKWFWIPTLFQCTALWRGVLFREVFGPFGGNNALGQPHRYDFAHNGRFWHCDVFPDRLTVKNKKWMPEEECLDRVKGAEVLELVKAFEKTMRMSKTEMSDEDIHLNNFKYGVKRKIEF